MTSTTRTELLQLISDHPTGHNDTTIKKNFSELLDRYRAENPSATPATDVVLAIGESVYGTTPSPPPPAENNDDDKKPDPDPVVDFAYMKSFMKDVFLSYGVPEPRAETCSEVLIEADKRGIDSHGLGRLKPIYCDRIDQGILRPTMPINVLKESDTTAIVDGNLGLGLYIGPYCMEMAIRKAKTHGVGFVVAKNSTHYGIAGYYATMATEAGCIGMTGTNARPSIAPTFGVEPMLGTNPLCFGVPSDDGYPFVIDCATSVNQRGKIEKYAREGVATPKGAVIDLEGVERTDTEGILRDMVLGKCALTPLGGAGEDTGGYKGYGWATVVELFSTAFQSGPFGEDVCGVDRKTGAKKPMPLGHFFLAIDIEAICDLPTFKANTSKLLKAVRESKKSPKGPGRIWVAGEKEADCRLERTNQGGMKVVKALQKDMKVLRDVRPGLSEKYARLPFEDMGQ